MAATHLEVRPSGREDTKKVIRHTVVIDGLEARSQRDWVYWLLPTVCTSQVIIRICLLEEQEAGMGKEDGE